MSASGIPQSVALGMKARLEQVLPYLYLLDEREINTAKPVKMMIDQIVSVLAEANAACS